MTGNDMQEIKANDPAHRLESNVRSYVRSFPFVAKTASGSTITSADGVEYIDFLAGAGALNYGHNNPVIQQALLDYVSGDGIAHSLDFATVAKNEFIETFDSAVLQPRGMDYRFQFCGPTGTNAVEAAIKIARKVTGRRDIFGFTHGFHGMTTGSLELTDNPYYKEGLPGFDQCTHGPLPFCTDESTLEASISSIADTLQRRSQNDDAPAAIIVEPIQGEGGINIAPMGWLRALDTLCKQFGVLLIVDDIQMGCGRTGDFFSFEKAGIDPDVIVLSKSIGGYGLPMALVLLKPQHDVWKPGQHNGTFRGNNLAFVAATKALAHFWQDTDFADEIRAKAEHIEERLQSLASDYSALDLFYRGKGFVWGLESRREPAIAGMIQKMSFERGLIIETCGRSDQVLKFLAPLTSSLKEIDRGFEILTDVCDMLDAQYALDGARARKAASA
ncbi:aspartate aminotransferase family protein [Roseibium sp. HPY-6]|uniref:aspartate aminotransferase family protein n=1 Tax=Roseibium sp. HPY-6 TaxID=3229852 RepID=UPI00338E0CF2